MDEKKAVTQEVTITPEAANEIRRIRLENQIPDSHALRMGVKSRWMLWVIILAWLSMIKRRKQIK